jgi:serine protease AprX
VVSNGNFGGQGCASTYGPPAYFEESFSVGATNDQEMIAGFSSKGPVTIDSSFRVKPNVVAPGVNVRSSVPNEGYANFGGTSMAGPHVVGLVALILSARPDLAGQVDLIEDIVERTAIYYLDPLGCTDAPEALPNNTFGYGRVDALAAVRMALLQTPNQDVKNDVVTAKVSPNPADDRVVFEIKGMYGPATIRFFDANGSVVHTYTWNAQGTDWPKISLGHLPAGVLFWKVEAAQGITSGKLVRGE